ncbi:expressed protein [Phakopsora pachyrhizi]|uniref:Expressed protein n=1 Tax=Phakopsora pachyrhizi TaxID=170000 RepID=A0AAV0B4T3_PHAPC|nr:expressed protein [Phakopsora pachyrhizi]
MFAQRVCFLFWLNPTLIFWNRGVQGLFNIKSFGEKGEHLSHDSASWNSRDFYNPQQNIHVEDGSRMLPSSYPVSGDSSNQMAGEYNDWGDEISPVDEWYNHPDSAPNIEDAMNYRPQYTWNYETVEHSSLPGHNHQEVSYPHVGSSQDQASSSNNIQPVYNGDFYYGDHVNFEPHSNEWHPVPSFSPQAHQNVQTPYNGQMTETPDFHSIQNELLYSPHLPETSNRFYQNFDWDASNLNPALSSHNSGFKNTGAEIDHRGNSIGNQNSVSGTSKNPTGEEASPNIGAGNFYKGRMLRLIDVLKEGFSTCSQETVFKKYGLEAIPEEEAEYENPNIIDIPATTIEPSTQDPMRNYRQKLCRDLVNVLRIQWNGPDTLENEIFQFAYNFVLNQWGDKYPKAEEHIVQISIMGITYMKIIAKMYPTKSSEEFGRDESLFNYTEKFWNHCFSKHKEKEEAFRNFFKSIREGTSEDVAEEILSADFMRGKNTPYQIFSSIAKFTSSATYERLYRFAWYFCFFRTAVYYPELLFKLDTIPGNRLKKFIQMGISSFTQN